MRQIWIPAIALAMGNALAQAPADYHQRVVENYRASFKAHDRNGDGRITREELRGDVRLEPLFDEIDINRDEQITAEELERFLSNIPARWR
jgi:hypothetical protein